jgi:hypothetical protein
MTNRKQLILGVLIAVIVAGAGAFYGGTVYEKNSLASQGMLRGGGNGQFRGNGQGGPGGPDNQGQGRQFGFRGPNPNGDNTDFAAGQITAKDDKSVTVKDRNGSSKIIFFSDSTTVGKAVQGSASDLNVGQQIVANGKNNPDGSLSAQNIQIRPDQPQNQQ